MPDRIEETRWAPTGMVEPRNGRLEKVLDSLPLDWSVKSRLKIYSDTPFEFLSGCARDEFKGMQAFLANENVGLLRKTCSHPLHLVVHLDVRALANRPTSMDASFRTSHFEKSYFSV